MKSNQASWVLKVYKAIIQSPRRAMRNQLIVRLFSLLAIFSMLLSAVGMPNITAKAATTVTLDGAVSSATGAANATSVSFSHTTGTGTNRLMLVGVSWNCGSTDRTISSVTFTPSGGTATSFTVVRTEKAGSQLRYSAIYSLLNPPTDQTGTVAITFSGTVASGIVAGSANFAGVDQTTPLGSSNGANGNSTTQSVTLTGLTGNELVFDNAFQGASSSSQTLTAGSGQTQLWNDYVSSTRAASSTEEATSASVTMSWTAASTSYWAIAAVPINPAPAGPTHNLTIVQAGTGSGTLTPTVGTHSYAEGSIVSLVASAATGSTFNGWSGDADCTDGSVTMNTDISCTATFTLNTHTLTISTAGAGTGTVSPTVGPHTYDYGTVVTLEATEDTGFTFDGWSGNADCEDGSVTMDADKACTATFSVYVPSPLGLDGSVSSNTADGVSSISVSHTTGTGTDRLMLVGVSANSYNGAQSISSITFTPSGGSAAALSLVGSIENESGRLAAIYSLLNPPKGAVGTVTVTFSGSVGSGIVVGVANFAGVDQADPLDDFVSAVGTETTAISVDVPTDVNDLVFDMVFLGAATIPSLTADGSQTQLWNATIDRTRGVASTEVATSGTTPMSWTASGGATAYYWAIGAVPINPLPATNYDLTMAVSPTGGGTTTPAVGVHSFSENEVVDISATAATGYEFNHWTGDAADANSASTTVTMDADQTVTAYFTLLPPSGSATSSAVPSDATPDTGEQIEVAINIDVSGVNAPHNALGSFTASLNWDPTILSYDSNSGILAGFTGAVNVSQVSLGQISFNGANTSGATGNNTVFRITFDTVGAGSSPLNLEYSAMAAAVTFGDLLPILTVNDGQVDVSLTQHTISATAGSNGSITPSGAVLVNYGADQEFSIAANTGYHIEDVLVDDATVGAVASYTFYNVTADHTIAASFAINTYDLTIAKAGAGSGTVTPAVGEHNYDYGTIVTLEATADTGSTFNGWSGDIDCVDGSVTMDADKACTATFTLNTTTYDLTIAKAGNGSGTVTPAVGVHTYAEDTVVTLEATAATGSTFDSWSGNADCEDGSVTMNADKACTATFTLNTYDLTIAKAGAGSGTVTPAVGEHNYDYGTIVTLEATADTGSTFDSWSGNADCEDGSVTMNADKACTATFTLNTYDLTIAKAGAGSGTVTPAVGEHNYDYGTIVTLEATADTGSTFDGWSGNADCEDGSVTMNADKACTATFTLNTYDLTIAKAGAGSGTVTPAVGEHNYDYGTIVTLEATADTGSTFDGWSGNADCEDGSVTMNADKACTATFSVNVSGSPVLDGTVSSGTADGVSTISIAHTTGTGVNRLMLVGVSANSYNGARTISSITFTPSGGSATALSLVGSVENESGRLAAIYSYLNPPSGVAGAVTVTFSDSVAYGIVVGAANFAGVNQVDPLDDYVSAVGTETSAISVDVSTDLNDLVFDTVFLGSATPVPSLAVDASQSQLWNATSDRTRGVASTELATSSTTPMSWTASGTTTSYFWAIGAIPINPAPAGTTYDLTMAVSPTGGGTTTPSVGAHSYSENEVVNISATPADGYDFANWTGDVVDANSASTTVTVDGDKTVTANFISEPTEITFTGEELLGRPTDSSISVKIVPDSAITLFYEYGITSGEYTGQTTQVAASAGVPNTVIISGLTANTKYYYRMQYSTDGGMSWLARSEHSFWTQRDEGSTFTFDITSDSHVNIQLGNSSNWISTLNGIASDNPDFLIDLGDTFAMDNGSASVTLGDIATAEQKYKDQLPYFNIVSASSPIYIIPGNHEQQEAWHLQGTLANSLPVMGKNAEKKFFLNPINDSFYSGDTSTYSYLSDDQLKQDYFSWTWGDALFVVISPYWTTTTKPYVTSAGGGEADATGSGNRWDWTLGQTQFDWLKSTLEGSSAKYKFVFSHQIVGGNGMTSPVNQVNYGHGGVDSANFVEWGGYDTDGTTYTWGANRSGWGSQPIRQMMEANNVTAFFHGHDHQFAYESLNGMVYQAVPSGSFFGSFGNYTTGGNSGNTIWADSTQGPGHLRVTVSPSQTEVEFIRYNASSAAYSYTIEQTYDLTMAADPSSGGTTNPVAGVHAYAEDSVVNISATAASGYEFDYWEGEVADPNSASTTVTMDANKSVTAHFESTLPTGTATSSAIPSNGTPSVGQQIVVEISIDVSDVDSPDDALGSFTASLDWDPAVLSYNSNSGILAGFAGAVNVSQVSTGHIAFNGANASGATGDVTVFRITFDAVGAGSSVLNLEYSAMAAAVTFGDLLPILTVNDGQVDVSLIQYTITATAGSNGSITPSGAVMVNSGADQTFSISANTGYHVADVLVDGVSVGAVTSYTFNDVAVNHTIAASFAIDVFTITASAGSGGTINPSGAVSVNYNADQTFTIAASTGYHVVDVLVDGVSVGALTSYTFNDVVANHTISASFAIDVFTITASAGSGGTINPSGAVSVNYNADQTFTIAASTGYHVVDVLVDGVSVGALTSYTFNDVAANHTIAASFAIDVFTITASAGSGGTINPSGAVSVNYNADQTFTIAASTGYHVVDVLVDGVSVGALTSYTFNDVVANHTISASFAIDVFTITASAGSGGSIDPTGAVSVNYNADQTFTIAASTGYHVVNVLVDGVSVGALTSYTFSDVVANHTIAASFAIDVFTITASAGSGGSIDPTGAVSVNYNADQSFTIAANTGYHVADVLVDGVSMGALTTYTFNDVAANHSISASFAINAFTITASAGSGGSIDPTGAVGVDYGADQTFAIAASTGYHVVDVLVDGVSVGALTTYTFNDVAANHTIAASFAIDVFTITASAGSGGSIDPTGAVGVDYGADQSFSITASTGYHVVDVLVDDVSVGALTSYTFNDVVANHTIAASFAIDNYTLNYSAGIGGNLTGNTSQIVNYGEDGTAVTAVPADGYHFVDWSDGSIDNPRTDTNVMADVDVVANFSLNEYTLTVVSEHGTVTKDPDQATYHYGDEVTLNMTNVESGWTFTGWTPTLTENKVTITGDTTVTANFTENQAPIITEGDSIDVTMTGIFDLTLHATDVDGDELTWSISSPASHGEAEASGTGASMVIGYTPLEDYTGVDSFVVQVADDDGGIDTIIVNVTINPAEVIRYQTFLPVLMH